MIKAVYRDVLGNEIRLTEERYLHIIERGELLNEDWRIHETLQSPDVIKTSNYDDDVFLYYKYYPKTPVTRKHLAVVAKITLSDSFILTAFFTDKIKEGKSRWIR